MRRAVRITLAALFAMVCAAGPAVAHGRAPASTDLLINAQEWSLWPSRHSVPAGPVHVELWNRGQDMHDTMVRRLNAAGEMIGPVLGRVRVTMPGQVSQATWHLRTGLYELYCSMPGHMQLGMHAQLTVTRAQRSSHQATSFAS